MKDALPEILGRAEPGGGAEEHSQDEAPRALTEGGHEWAQKGVGHLGGEEEVHCGGAEEREQH